MNTPEIEPSRAAPALLTAFACQSRIEAMDFGSAECLELLEHLVFRLGERRGESSEGMEEACIYLLEHLAAHLKERPIQ